MLSVGAVCTSAGFFSLKHQLVMREVRGYQLLTARRRSGQDCCQHSLGSSSPVYFEFFRFSKYMYCFCFSYPLQEVLFV